METQKLWAQIIGVILVLTGILGFFMSPILGLVEVNPAHNVVHILTGLVFLWAGFMHGPAKQVNQWVGVVYILVAIVGFLGYLTFLMVDAGMAFDNFLHLGIGVVSALIGWLVK